MTSYMKTLPNNGRLSAALRRWLPGGSIETIRAMEHQRLADAAEIADQATEIARVRGVCAGLDARNMVDKLRAIEPSLALAAADADKVRAVEAERERAAQCAESVGSVYAETATKTVIGREAIDLCNLCANVARIIAERIRARSDGGAA
jgi:hypothetical protein